METKMIRVPFEVELAKKITEKSVDGKIVTRDGRSVRIICFDAHCDDNIVALVEDSLGIESTFNYLNDGKFYIGDEKECDLFIEIPEYMTFKEGDMIAFDNVKDVFFIIGSKCSMTDENPHYYVKYEKGYLTFGVEDSFCRLKYSRLVTEEEKQKLIDALKSSKEPKAKEYLKRFFGIEVKQEYEFKPFDKVLVRDDDGIWFAGFFSHLRKDGEFLCVGGGLWEQCIPYNEQTAHLLGTTENYE